MLQTYLDSFTEGILEEESTPQEPQPEDRGPVTLPRCRN